MPSLASWLRSRRWGSADAALVESAEEVGPNLARDAVLGRLGGNRVPARGHEPFVLEVLPEVVRLPGEKFALARLNWGALGERGLVA